MFQTLFAAKVIYVLAIISLVSGILIFFSCRCLPGSRIASNWMKNERYKRFYKFHCYFWWILLVSVIIHGVFAIGFLGNPFS